MVILNLTTLLINSVLLLLIIIKFSKLEFLKEEYLSLRNDFEQLLCENTYLSTQYLDGLEEKINEGEKILQHLREEEKNLKEGLTFTEEDNEEKYNPVTLEMAKLLQQGNSISEIAEKLNTTKGEVVLRLNLGEKIAGQK